MEGVCSVVWMEHSGIECRVREDVVGDASVMVKRWCRG